MKLLLSVVVVYGPGIIPGPFFGLNSLIAMEKLLQKLISEEIHASASYEAIANIFKSKGLDEEADEIKKISAEELEHVEELTELANLINVKVWFKPIEDVEISNHSFKTSLEANTHALDLEIDAVNSYEEALEYLKQYAKKDFYDGFKKMFEHIYEEEVEHEKIFKALLAKDPKLQLYIPSKEEQHLNVVNALQKQVIKHFFF